MITKRMFKAGRRNTELGQNKACFEISNLIVLLEYKCLKKRVRTIGRWGINTVRSWYHNLKICTYLESVCQNNMETDF